MFVVTLSNNAGVLDTRTCKTEREAAVIAIEMIKDSSYLNHGDSIKVEEIEE